MARNKIKFFTMIIKYGHTCDWHNVYCFDTRGESDNSKWVSYSTIKDVYWFVRLNYVRYF